MVKAGEGKIILAIPREHICGAGVSWVLDNRAAEVGFTTKHALPEPSALRTISFNVMKNSTMYPFMVPPPSLLLSTSYPSHPPTATVQMNSARTITK